jgi:photosystem II stability/assembly factor-like uncharacterized protein
MRRPTLLALALVLSAAAAAQPAGEAGAGPHPATPAAARLAGAEARRALEDRSLLAELPLRSIGPTVMGGRVTDLEGKPGDPAQFYVAYASGGLWRTTNGGTSFTPLFDAMPAITIGDIAVDWADPEGDGPTVWVGTGESNSSRSSYAGTGVYVSTDGGATWAHRGLDDSHHIGRLLIDPDRPGTAWVAAIGPLYSTGGQRGVFRTEDFGATWQHALNPGPGAGAIQVLRDPGEPGRLFAATWTRARRAWDFQEAGPGSAVWRSDDDGRSWERVPAAGLPSGDAVGRIGLDVHPSGRLFAVVDNQARRPAEPDAEAPALTREALRTMTAAQFLALSDDDVNAFLDANSFSYAYTAESVKEKVRAGTIAPAALVDFVDDANRDLFDTPVVGAEVYRSDDLGATWTRTHADFLDNLVYTYGYYFGEVRVAPDDRDRLYVLGVPMIASADGGATWARADDAHVHVDHHALWMDPTRPGMLLNGNDGGLNASYDAGASWSRIGGPAVGQFYTVQVDDARPYNVYGGLQDNGVWTGPSTYRASAGWLSDGRYPYRSLLGGDGMQVQVDPRDGTVYTGFQFGNYVRIPGGGGRQARVTPGHALGERPLRFNWQTPIHLSRHLPDVLYFGSNRLHRSLDRGATWEALSPDLTHGERPGDVPYGTLTSIHESPLEFGLLAAGSDDGRVWVSEDGGRDWRDASAGLPADLWVSRVELSAHHRARLLVSLNGYRWDHFDAYVYRSDDLGRTWQRLGTDLPAEPVNVVREDPANEHALYVGTDGGLYASLDGGATFHGMRGQRARAADGGPGRNAQDARTMPNVPVHDLAIQARDRDLVVGTHGRSIWVADIALLGRMTPDVLAAPLHLFAPDTLTHRTNWGTRGYTWSDPPEPALDLAYVAAEGGEATVRVLDAGGAVLRTVSDVAEPGLNLARYDLSADRALADDHTAGEETGRFYLLPGAYEVEVRLGRHTVRAPLVVREGPAPPSRARKRMP